VLDSLAWNTTTFYVHWQQLALQKQVARARKANQLRAQVARSTAKATHTAAATIRGRRRSTERQHFAQHLA